MIATFLFGALLVAASSWDVLRLRIPNIIPLALILLFALQLVIGPGVPAPLDHLLAMGIALLVLLPPFALNVLGGGDVKLLAAVALWLGKDQVTALLILVGIVGGLFALCWLAMRWLIRIGLRGRRVPPSLQAHAPLPFALPITIVAALLFDSN
jgi:prepilin peptidase CpaA